MPDFLPRRDAELLAWSSCFDSNIYADPESFGLSADMAAEYRTLHLAFAEAYRAAVAPGERTAGKIAAKDGARAALKDKARELAGVVKANPGVTATQWINLALRGPQGGRRIAHPRPGDAPRVTVRQRGGSRFRVTLRDVSMPTSTAKPKGVGSACLQYSTGQTPPAAGRGLKYLAAPTRTTMDVTIPGSLPAGTRVWIIAQWSSPNGRRGPASDPSMTWIAGESPLAA
jgi:hypothetical protein